ncbi:hypothetical protein VCHA51O444_60041 [Vibrio chagasii]|nr:hypothetical protein VCHA43P275_30264 [Vibrio chagasii]CAH7301129.1 hypothetical protein VCHA53O473_30040 [Vibrio chagasii]CAH7441812.1 hypothetical protein VCHA51O444_60041 [Vibrio chagasii]
MVTFSNSELSRSVLDGSYSIFAMQYKKRLWSGSLFVTLKLLILFTRDEVV